MTSNQLRKPPHRVFRALIVGLHQRLGLPVPPGFEPLPGIASSVEFEHSRVRFRIDHDPGLDASTLGVQCCYGQVPEAEARQVLVRLLEINLVLAAYRGRAFFGVDPDSGDVVYALGGPLHAMTADSLAQAILMSVEQALHWRETFLLEDPFAGIGPRFGDPCVMQA